MPPITRRQFVTRSAGATAGLLLAPRDTFAWGRALAPTQLPDTLKLHGYPYGKTHYLSRNEWPLLSAQGHWTAPTLNGGMIAHTHVECWAPIWAELPRTPFTIPCRMQLFHTAGGIYGGKDYGTRVWLSRSIQWDSPAPIVGDPNGLVVRYFDVTIDPELLQPNGGGGSDIPVPLNGKFLVHVIVSTLFDDGTKMDTTLCLPFYGAGDLSQPETPMAPGFHWNLEADVAVATGGLTGGNHGVANSELTDGYLPILGPLTDRVTVPMTVAVYARGEGKPYVFAANDKQRQVNDADLHNGNPGQIVYEALAPASIEMPAVFDPVALGPGVHNIAIEWHQDTGTGNADYAPGEHLSSRLVVLVPVGPNAVLPPPPAGMPIPPPPPPPPGNPVACQGTISYPVANETPQSITFAPPVFTVTTPPANGGATCLDVARALLKGGG